MAFMSTFNSKNKPRSKAMYFDMEFTGLHKNSTIISIGIVSDDDKKFYAEYTDFDRHQCDKWIQENVISNLVLNKDKLPDYIDELTTTVKGTKSEVRKAFYKWIDDVYGPKQTDEDLITIYSDCLAYDWVLFIDAFYDNALKLDSRFYYIPIDLCTLLYADHNGNPDVSREDYVNFYNGGNGKELPESEQKHNSLWDAIVIKKATLKAEDVIKWQSPH